MLSKYVVSYPAAPFLQKKHDLSEKCFRRYFKGDILKMQLYNTFLKENSINNQRIKVCLLKVTKRCGF